jgi:hypothetical protein
VKTFLGALLLAAAVAAAAPAGADPADHVPYCTGSQTPTDSNCRLAPAQPAPQPRSGLSPDLPYGLAPGQQPAL